MDNHNKKTRSYNMSQIHSTNTKPEEIVRKFLFSKGLRYRKNVQQLPGKPDIVLKKYKTVICVNGCFWHMHNDCGKFVWPSTNVEYWQKKIYRNVERDKTNYQKLSDLGWRIIIVWECTLKKSLRAETLNNVYEEIMSNLEE